MILVVIWKSQVFLEYLTIINKAPLGLGGDENPWWFQTLLGCGGGVSVGTKIISEGGAFMPKYLNLQSLVNSDSKAMEYFSSLPDYVREQIQSRADNVNSFDSLRDYAENLLRGDQ